MSQVPIELSPPPPPQGGDGDCSIDPLIEIGKLLFFKIIVSVPVFCYLI